MISSNLDLKNDKPFYLQLTEAIKGRITDNTWRLGMMIPSENELAKEYQLQSPVIAGTAQDYLEARDAGYGDEAHSSVIRLLEEKADVYVRSPK